MSEFYTYPQVYEAMQRVADYHNSLVEKHVLGILNQTDMESRFEDMTKEQLIAELNVATEKLKYYRTIEDHARSGIQLSPQELSARLAIAEANLAARQQELVLVYEKNKYLLDRVAQFEQEEKKREFERRLAEATDFLKANGYEIRPQKINLDPQTMDSAVLVRKAERIWRDEDMKMFGNYCYGSPTEELINQLFDRFIKKIQ